MAKSTMKSKHAFGSEKNISKALNSGVIDAYDILFLDEGKIGWIDADGNIVIAKDPESGITETIVDKKIGVAIDEVTEYTDNRIDYILNSIEDGAQVNDIEAISLGGVELEIIEKTVNVPIGAGLKESAEVLIDDEGTLTVGKIGFNNITQVEGEIVIFDGGSSAE